MTQKLGEVTEVPLGDVVAVQHYGKSKKSIYSGRNVVSAILIIVVAAAVIIGVLSATGVDFSSSDTSKTVVEKDALIPNTGSDNNTQSESPSDSPVQEIVGQTECQFQNSFDVNGDGSLILRSGINSEEGTVTVELEYAGEAWLGFAFTESPAMVPNTAIIGLPNENKVEKFSLESRSLDGVNPLNVRQTLSATSIIQSNGSTKLTFTKPLVEESEVSISGVGDIRFNWAVGSSNELGIHARRGSTVALFAACQVEENEDEKLQSTSPTFAPAPDLVTDAPIGSPVSAAPISSVTPSPTFSKTEAPTNKLTSAPTYSVTSAPTGTPTHAPVTHAPTATPIDHGAI